MIYNQQKHNWAWDEKVFYILKNGDIYELKFLWQKNHQNHYEIPYINKKDIVARFVCKSKVDRLLTVQTGNLTYKK